MWLKIKRYEYLCLICLLMPILSLPALAAGSPQITAIKPDHAGKVITIKTKGTVGKHRARVIGEPNRLVIDFEGTQVGKMPPRNNPGRGNINEIRVGHSKGRARVVLDFGNNAVPAFKIERKRDRIRVLMGEPLSLPPKKRMASSTKRAEPKRTKKAAKGHLSPKPVKAASNSPKLDLDAVPLIWANKGKRGAKAISSKKPVPLAKKPATPPSPASPWVQSAKRGNAQAVASKAVNKKAPKPQSKRGKKSMRLAQASLLDSGSASTRRSGSGSSLPSSRRSGSRGVGMVREVRPPVTPPTPDPRLVVQEITELKFIQVGHNGRLVIRGGDHLDYRMNKVSPTRVRIDLINAEIPKPHQKPLQTDLFSTSVEMIVPGSQTIFIQLKDAVPYQVEKKKGVLMVDFPPPRFHMTADQKALMTGGGAGDQSGRDDYAAKREALRASREAAQMVRLNLLEDKVKNADKKVQDLEKKQDEIFKERKEIEARYPLVTPDPEVFSKPITMNFTGIHLKNAFRLLAEQAGINIIVGPEVTGTVTLNLFKVPMGQVIDHMLATNQLERDLRGNVLWIGSRENIARNKRLRRQARDRLITSLQKRLTQNRKEIRELEREKEDALKQVEKVKTDAEATPTDNANVETVGATETIEIDGEPVTLLLVQVRLSYARVAQIRPILECVFNRRCTGIAPAPQETQAAAAGQYTRELARQGFAPGSPGYEARMQRFQRDQRQERRTRAAEEVARRLAGDEVASGLAAGQMDERMQKILAHTIIWANATYNMLFIKDLPERIEEMKKLIASLDVPTPQVLIESRVVQADRTWSRGLGVLWGGSSNQLGNVLPDMTQVWGLTGNQGAAAANDASGVVIGAGDIPSHFAVNLPAEIANIDTPLGLGAQFGLFNAEWATNLDLRLQFGESRNKLKIIARPKVQVLDGNAATIINGQTIAYATTSADGTQVQLVQVNLQLTVTPRIYPDGRVQMNINVTDNDVGDIVNGLASINTREATTVMIVKDAETAVIGGILRRTDSSSVTGWPGFMNLPIVNTLFSNKGRVNRVQELLVFITPNIVKRPPPAS
ncbi:AMIN domain-containing protein [Thermodesulfobacteriota bacterium]